MIRKLRTNTTNDLAVTKNFFLFENSFMVMQTTLHLSSLGLFDKNIKLKH